ncbi:hypothetical protein CASFOL_008810 [Castilleja foliolosa]|uniref:Uncharacterized protein n=1 Tax=Castilleja foliolosa TaxID=1961234 RepID=A0ABD3E236_9LAMI
MDHIQCIPGGPFVSVSIVVTLIIKLINKLHAFQKKKKK